MRIALALTALLVLGCESKTGKTGEHVADQLQTIRDDMCKCKDETCANQAMARFEKFFADNQYETGDKYAKARVERLTKELMTCDRRARLKAAAAKAPPAPGFPVDRNNPPIGLDKLATEWKPIEGGMTLAVSFDATIHKMMANSHQLKVHAACTGLEKPRENEATISGEDLGGTTVGNTTSNAVTLFAKKPLAGRPTSCALSFRTSGAPADFERVCVRGNDVTPGDCKDAPPAKDAPADAPATP